MSKGVKGSSSPSKECAICLKKNKKNQKLITLPCSHTYHKECFHPWDWKNLKQMECHMPLKGWRQMCFFPSGQNCVSCPICRTEYTHNVCNNGKFEKILAKVHAEDNMVLYITKNQDLYNFIPISENINDKGESFKIKDGLRAEEYRISPKWATIIFYLLMGIKRGKTDLYIVKRLTPEPDDYILSNETLIRHPVDKDGEFLTGEPGTLGINELLTLKELGKKILQEK
jgi:hypothetical protein